jgi:hypothetical protein
MRGEFHSFICGSIRPDFRMLDAEALEAIFANRDM